MKRENVNDLLTRYIKGECTADEIHVVEEWLAQNWEDNNEWKLMDDYSRQQWLSSLYGDIQNTIQLENKNRVKPLSHYKVWKSVASIAALLLVTFGLYFTLSLLKSWNAPISYQQVSVPSGELKELVLEDGTRLWLNSKSSLKYPLKFNGREREVYLDGEAYFEVAHNDKQPFVVHTGELKTRVLGTIFNIVAYQDHAEVKVVLLSGKVEVMKEDDLNEVNPLILQPKQVAKYQKGDQALSKSDINDTNQYSAWKDGKLIFDETLLNEVLDRLSVSYNVRFVLKNPKLNGCKITGSFTTLQKIDQIVESIVLSIGGKYIKNSNQFILDGEGCIMAANILSQH